MVNTVKAPASLNSQHTETSRRLLPTNCLTILLAWRLKGLLYFYRKLYIQIIPALPNLVQEMKNMFRKSGKKTRAI